MNENRCYLTASLFLPFFILPVLAHSQPVTNSFQQFSKGVILYTPYISRSATPGEDISYSISVINQSNKIENVSFSFQGMPGSWDPRLSSSSNTIQRVAVKPKKLAKNHSKTVTLHLSIPLKISKGIHRFIIRAETDNGDSYELPVEVNIMESGTLSTSMKVQQANMQGYAGDDFNYHFVLYNKTAQDQTYALMSNPPPGWVARFRVSGNYATSVRLGSNSNKTIYVKVTAPKNAESDTYNIPIRASAGNSHAQDTLQTVIKGKYKLNLTTPTGRLSTEITAGSKTKLKLKLVNTGSLPLHNIKLSSTKPADWDVSFKKKKVNRLKPGETMFVDATIKASDKAIAGDYQLQIDANTNNSSSSAKFRVTVGKSLLWGGISIAIIVVVIGGIFMMVRTYGRR